MPPSGTVSFLFTDIEGSTKLAQQYPHQWDVMQQRHHVILTEAIESHNGYIFQIIGDAFCAAFHTANNGLGAAIEAQRKLQTEKWDGTPVKVRMGLHTGPAEFQESQYHGYMTLVRVQRVMSVAYGGQILLSNVSAELIHDELPEGTTLRDMKEQRLKGLLNPEHLWQIVVPDMQQDFPPLQSLNEIPNNLPVQLTSFIGRENEIAELKHELVSHRLITLTGSGGTGKTRLSLRIAAELLEKFDHGVWFVGLAQLTDPELIPQSICSVFGINEQAGKVPLALLKEYLHTKQLLLILDNCEHLISASARVVDVLLNTAPGLRVLASSREALGVKGEFSYPVPSLSVPDLKHLPAIEQLSQYEAVQLFIDRALLGAPHFVMDKDNAPFIAQICFRLDGIPLAIELAAARVKMLSVEQITKRLDDRFRLLTGGARTALPRQQTLRALIDWSYDILSDNERLLLQRLSVFAGGWTLEAAEEVCVGQDDILPYDILDLLSQLVNKSLVVVMEHSLSGETRYRMLETIRQYAREKMLEEGGGEIIRRQHLSYFVKLIKQAGPELYRSNQLHWLNRLEDELDNLRMALEWALAADVEAGLRIASIPWRFWDVRGYFQENGNWLKRLLEQYKTTDILCARALAVCSLFNFRQGNLEAGKIAEESLQMARMLSDKESEAFSLSFLGVFNQYQGNFETGELILEQSLNLYRALEDKVGQATTLESLSTFGRDLEHAIAFAKESLGIYRELGSLSGIANSLSTLARLTIMSGDLSSPIPWLQEAHSISHQIGDYLAEALNVVNYGIYAYWHGEYQQAIAYYDEATRLCEERSLGIYPWIQVHKVYAVLRHGDVQQAREMFEDSIRRTQEMNVKIFLVYAIEGLSSLHVIQNQTGHAARLFAWADSMRENIGNRRPPIEQASVDKDLAIIHSKMDDVEFTRLSAEGRAMTVEQAIALALGE